jgi:F-type H+-transporting ATPase subunit b
MLIDWFTVGAQVVNFLILVWLLKRFLYKPILDAIDAREKRIADELADAGAKQSQARKQRDEFQKKNEEFDQQRDELLNKAKDEATAERQRLLEETRRAADGLRVMQKDALKREQASLNEEIGRRTREEVFSIARKTLMDLAGTSLEERMSEAFTRRLRELDDEARGGLAKALSTSPDAALVRSAFDLPPEQQAAIQHALNETFSDEVRLRFETAPDLISGIELTASGQRVAWSIAGYLVSLKESIGELVEEQAETERRSGSKHGAPSEVK